MSELSRLRGSEGYGVCSDEVAVPPWSSWKARNCRALPACWTPEAGHPPLWILSEGSPAYFHEKYDYMLDKSPFFRYKIIGFKFAHQWVRPEIRHTHIKGDL